MSVAVCQAMMQASDWANVRVLIVEDEFLIAELTKDLLHELGVENIVIAERLDTGLAAVAASDDEPFDVAVLDVTLYDATSELIAHALEARHVPFLFVTGYDRLTGAFAKSPFLRKPYRFDALEHAVEALVRH